ncbi:MAG: hypothetical protein Ct9H300mP21_07080 [Pseudomonadota bacterium]|nr:MAG: hypothetical protein Ct9H300mP21_07080 [Pseudomonadota bacterium]
MPPYLRLRLQKGDTSGSWSLFSGSHRNVVNYSNGARSVMMGPWMISCHNGNPSCITSSSFGKFTHTRTNPGSNGNHVLGLKKYGNSDPILGIPGLNPHAGENRFLDLKKISLFVLQGKLARGKGIRCEGPFPLRIKFFWEKHRKGRFDPVVPMYHDQALIPLKLFGFERAVNVTLGLPIIRTSPDHGTAFELAPQISLIPGLMIEANKTAIKIAIHLFFPLTR